MFIMLVALHFLLSHTEQVAEIRDLRDVPVLDLTILVYSCSIVFQPQLDGRSYRSIGLVDAIKMGRR